MTDKNKFMHKISAYYCPKCEKIYNKPINKSWELSYCPSCYPEPKREKEVKMDITLNLLCPSCGHFIEAKQETSRKANYCPECLKNGDQNV